MGLKALLGGGKKGDPKKEEEGAQTAVNTATTGASIT